MNDQCGLRWIAWCFGSGSRALRRTAADPRFGLLAALNAREYVGESTVLECLRAELALNDEQYIAYDGDFYRVDRAFKERIDDEVRALPLAGLTLPCCGGRDERSYNKAAGLTPLDGFAVIDRSLIRLPGESAIEACDLVGASGALVHVKRKGKSSTLSPLVFQARNSCDILRRSSEARQQLQAMIKESNSSPNVVNSAVESIAMFEDDTRYAPSKPA